MATKAKVATSAPAAEGTNKTVVDTADAAAEARHNALVAELSIVFNAMAANVIPMIRQLSSVTTHWNAEQGFWECDNFGEKIALIHSELSEALEAHRKNLPSDHIVGFPGVAEELADALIRIFDLAGKLQIPLGEALMAKLQYNLSRPYKHGKAY